MGETVAVIRQQYVSDDCRKSFYAIGIINNKKDYFKIIPRRRNYTACKPKDFPERFRAVKQRDPVMRNNAKNRRNKILL
ncbi:MAG: hypothetical protein FWF92_09745 [Oscillospiraceae bacterium]|nr:hypothetical protein [Oscillospiraceae bacterium]